MNMEVSMKRGLFLLVAASVALLCLGMGGLGGQPGGSVPETEINIQAQVKDRVGTVTDLNQFSMDGKTYLEAWHGKGKLSIPFQQVGTITFGEIRGDAVMAEVRLKSGEAISLSIRSRAQFYGSTGFGAFQIASRDVASIAIP
jgi:hypothetical protein